MDLAWAASGAVLGLLAGAALRGAVFTLAVPAGSPERVACPTCATPAGPTARCRHCGGPLGPPLAPGIAAAAVLALLLGVHGGRPGVLPAAFLAVLGVALATIDLAVQRLPDRLTLPAYPVLVGLLGVAALLAQDGPALMRALLGGIAMAGGYLVLAVARPGGIGGGDVKLAGLAGLVLGWWGWPVLAAGAALGFLLAACASLALLAARRITLAGSVAFGPHLLGGALLAVLAVP